MPTHGERVGTAVLGGGPAGLTAAYVLALRGAPGAVFEADGQVGGLAKTVAFDGYRFDLGGHRFFTRLDPVARLWEAMLGDEFLTRPRLSRIYYDGDYFSYPLRAKEVPRRLGYVESTRCAMSYLAGAWRRRRPAESFEDWVTTRFGRRLYDAFFRTYTEKVWGIPGSEIRSEWAAQRIRNFSLARAALSAAGIRQRNVTTLIEEFRYPRLGPGQMWERFQEFVEARHVPVHLRQRCTEIHHRNGRVTGIVLRSNGDETEVPVDGVVSSIPLSELILGLRPAAPAHVVEAARRLRYRDMCVVGLMLDDAEPFPDNWIYLHDPAVRAGRVQNFGAWSDAMVRPGTTCLGVEYFCFSGDELWELEPGRAVELAVEELAGIGLINPARVIDGIKIAVPKAYPTYDSRYAEAVAVLRGYLASFSNLHPCGRNGLHRYNNQDHSMWTAVLATLNLIDGASYDVWSVNADAVYHEEGERVAAELALPLEPAHDVRPTAPLSGAPAAELA